MTQNKSRGRNKPKRDNNGTVEYQCKRCWDTRSYEASWHTAENFPMCKDGRHTLMYCKRCHRPNKQTRKLDVQERPKNVASYGTTVEDFLNPKRYRLNADPRAQDTNFTGTHGIVPTRPGR